MAIQLDADRLRTAISRRGLTQAQFAAIVGMPPPQLSRVLNGRPVLPKTLDRISRALIDCRLHAGAELVRGGEAEPAL